MESPVGMAEVLTFCGRTFALDEVELMCRIWREFSALGVTEIAKTVCELLDWRRLGGGLKNHECRQLLERLAAPGRLQLPELRRCGGRGSRRADLSGPSIEPASVECTARECEPLELALVEGRQESRLWREQVERHHYLGCLVPFGANLRYWARNRDRELACLLSLSARQIPQDWKIRYGRRPLLLENLVDAARFRGTCYRAANWIHVGETTGRGRMDRDHKKHGQAVKDVYLYPLIHDARQRLRAESTR